MASGLHGGSMLRNPITGFVDTAHKNGNPLGRPGNRHLGHQSGWADHTPVDFDQCSFAVVDPLEQRPIDTLQLMQIRNIWDW